MDALLLNSEQRVPGVALGAYLGDTHCMDAPWDGWRVCCAVDMGTAIQKSQVMRLCRLSLTLSRLGNWEASTRPWVVATSSVASMYLELCTVDSVRAGPTAVLVKEAEVSDCLRGSRSSDMQDFGP